MGEKLSLKERALKLLSVRSRSRSELKWRLLRAGFDFAEVETALDDLEQVGLIDDAAFARDVIERQVVRRGSGDRAATMALRKAGVGADIADRALEEADTGDEEVRAEDLARTRLSRLRGLDEATAYRRLLGFLQRRGYDGSTARAACNRIFDEVSTSGT